jgi:hypothetical protein
MTTHETQPEATDPTVGGARPETAEPLREPTPDQTRMTTPVADAPSESVDPRLDTGSASLGEPVDMTQTGAPAEGLERPQDTNQLLFADGELEGLRSRWTDVQSAFVDDPRDCVQKADSLVADVVEKLTSGFSQARSRLEEQWARGEEASTEDLRIALKRYRDFFERLLAV